MQFNFLRLWLIILWKKPVAATDKYEVSSTTLQIHYLLHTSNQCFVAPFCFQKTTAADFGEFDDIKKMQ